MRPTPGTSNGSVTTLPPASVTRAAVSSALSTQTFVVQAASAPGCGDRGDVAAAQPADGVVRAPASDLPAEQRAVEVDRRPRRRAAACRPSRGLRARSRRARSSCAPFVASVGEPYHEVGEYQLDEWKFGPKSVDCRRWRPNGPTATAAASPARSTSSASAGRCWSCASCCSARSASPTCARACPALSPDVLSQRLRELEQAGLVRRRKLAAARGLARLRADRARAARSSRSCSSSAAGAAARRSRGRRRVRRRLLRDRAQDAVRPGRRRRARRDLRAAAGRARLPLPRGRAAGSRSPAAAPSGPTRSSRPTPGTLAAVLWHDRPLAEALRTGDVEIEGSTPAVKRFLGVFPAPSRPRERGLALARQLERELPQAPAGRAVVGLRVHRGDGLAVVEVARDAFELGVEREPHRRRDAVLEPVDGAARSPPAPSSSACRSRGAGSSPSPPWDRGARRARSPS